MNNNLFNKKLFWTVFLLSAVVIFKLGAVAQEYDNWRGFAYSTLHILIVAIGSFLVLRKKTNSEN